MHLLSTVIRSKAELISTALSVLLGPMKVKINLEKSMKAQREKGNGSMKNKKL